MSVTAFLSECLGYAYMFGGDRQTRRCAFLNPPFLWSLAQYLEQHCAWAVHVTDRALQVATGARVVGRGVGGVGARVTTRGLVGGGVGVMGLAQFTVVVPSLSATHRQLFVPLLSGLLLANVTLAFVLTHTIPWAVRI